MQKKHYLVSGMNLQNGGEILDSQNGGMTYLLIFQQNLGLGKELKKVFHRHGRMQLLLQKESGTDSQSG